jgi:hypothetical protein
MYGIPTTLATQKTNSIAVAGFIEQVKLNLFSTPLHDSHYFNYTVCADQGSDDFLGKVNKFNQIAS